MSRVGDFGKRVGDTFDKGAQSAGLVSRYASPIEVESLVDLMYYAGDRLNAFNPNVFTPMANEIPVDDNNMTVSGVHTSRLPKRVAEESRFRATHRWVDHFNHLCSEAGLEDAFEYDSERAGQDVAESIKKVEDLGYKSLDQVLAAKERMRDARQTLYSERLPDLAAAEALTAIAYGNFVDKKEKTVEVNGLLGVAEALAVRTEALYVLSNITEFNDITAELRRRIDSIRELYVGSKPVGIGGTRDSHGEGRDKVTCSLSDYAMAQLSYMANQFRNAPE